MFRHFYQKLNSCVTIRNLVLSRVRAELFSCQLYCVNPVFYYVNNRMAREPWRVAYKEGNSAPVGCPNDRTAMLIRPRKLYKVLLQGLGPYIESVQSETKLGFLFLMFTGFWTLNLETLILEIAYRNLLLLMNDCRS